MSNRQNLYLFMGPPGSGKGALSSLIVERQSWVKLSTGDLCRRNIQEQTPVGKEIDLIIKSGKLVSNSIISKMVKDWLLDQACKDNSIILDGYPRTLEQSKSFFEIIDTIDCSFDVNIVKLQVVDQEVVDRITSRLLCSNKQCQRVYSSRISSGCQPKNFSICDVCSSTLIKREDDTESVIRGRLKTYYDHEKSMVNYFLAKNASLVTINAMQSLSNVFLDLEKYVDKK